MHGLLKGSGIHFKRLWKTQIFILDSLYPAGIISIEYQNYFEGLKKAMKNVGQDSWSLGQDLNMGSLEYEATFSCSVRKLPFNFIWDISDITLYTDNEVTK